MTDVSRQTLWRKSNPEKAAQQNDRSTEARRQKMLENPEYAEAKRREARDAHRAKRQKIAEGAPDGWRVVVRMAGEKRGKSITSVVYTTDGRIRGLTRRKTGKEAPQTWETREEAHKIAETLLTSFPDKIESAREDVA